MAEERSEERSIEECREMAGQILQRLQDDLGLSYADTGCVIGIAAAMFYNSLLENMPKTAPMWLDGITTSFVKKQ